MTSALKRVVPVFWLKSKGREGEPVSTVSIALSIAGKLAKARSFRFSRGYRNSLPQGVIVSSRSP